MTSNGRGEDLEATLNQGMHRHFRHKNTNRFPPTKQSDSPVNTSSSPPPSPGLSQDDSEDEYMHVLEEFMDGNIIASRHRRQASVAYRGVEYALSPTLKSPPIVFPRIASPLSPQYYHRPSYQTQTPIQNGIRLQSPTPLYNRTQNFRNRPAPLQLQDSPTLGNWTHLTPQQQPPSPVATPYLLDDYYGGGDEDSDDDEFPIRPSAALLPYKRQQDQGDPPPPPPPQRKRLPDLLQDVLEIMDSITSQQSQLEEESMALQDMVELVVTMQEQADSLMEYSDLVEEYVDLVNDEVTPAQASPSSSSNYSVDAVDVREEEEEVEEEDPTDMDPGARELASRADSGGEVGRIEE
ncbi:hypothetical protein diail_2337 [Diaporthe ilicicola]|nr:hypothetical protein diail_2337 [Diaporthe ilicicola]